MSNDPEPRLSRRLRKQIAKALDQPFVPQAPPPIDVTPDQVQRFEQELQKQGKSLSAELQKAVEECYYFGQYRFWKDGRIDTMVVGGYEELEKHGEPWLAAKAELAAAVAAARAKKQAEAQ